MLPMINFKFADIVLVPFPFTNNLGFKKRPAVVISPNMYQQSRLDIILLAVTSRIQDQLGYGETMIENWQEAGLLKPSVLKPLIFTLEQSKVLMHLGCLTPSDQSHLQSVLGAIIGKV